ncbi:MAG: undecaprenyldiphospho-muramoylpentapeptide beta-N-acetylglucosaminyltransferase [Candidatus Ratteibacteria bacterium]|jgi:UDP-N-acetylglucosamine--N-acetylmuramyl-(pentapeptide) pyrophosphoryl-undecaprenol N-acetylglucosamine transferase
MGSKRKKIIIVVGSTGGHLFPGVALGEELLQRVSDLSLLFTGEKKLASQKVWKERNLSFEPIPIFKRPGLGRSMLGWPVRVFLAFKSAFSLLRRESPDLVIGTGSYATLPLLLAARCKKIPTLLHEQNVFPGLTTRFLVRFGIPVGLTFKESKEYLPRGMYRVTGMPVRKEFFEIREKKYEEFLLSPAKKSLLVFGGSQGASFINRLLLNTVMRLDPKKWQIIHLTGTSDFEEVSLFYRDAGIQSLVLPFYFDIYLLFAIADMAVCRAGAGTLTELSACSLPAVLIPFQYAGGHQILNAKAVSFPGRFTVLPENQATPSSLYEAMMRLEREKEQNSFSSSSPIADIHGNCALYAISLLRKR